MDPMTVAGAMWIGRTGYQTYAYWKRKKETQEAGARRALDIAIAEEQANIRAAAQEDYWREREEVRLKKLAHEKQLQDIELKVQEVLQNRKRREAQWRTEYLMENIENHEQEFQPNSPEMEEEIMKITGLKY
jgi:hypothetical protein